MVNYVFLTLNLRAQSYTFQIFAITSGLNYSDKGIQLYGVYVKLPHKFLLQLRRVPHIVTLNKLQLLQWYSCKRYLGCQFTWWSHNELQMSCVFTRQLM